MSVQTQVVAGVNYQLIVKLTSASGEIKYMTWTVSAQPWTNTYKLTSFQNTVPNRRLQAMGGWKTQTTDMNNPIISEAIKVALASITGEGSLLGTGDWSCSQVLSVQTQVVAGLNYKITGEFTNLSDGHTQTIEFVVNVPPGQTPSLKSATILLRNE